MTAERQPDEVLIEQARQFAGCTNCAGSGLMMIGATSMTCPRCDGVGTRRLRFDELAAFAQSILEARQQIEEDRDDWKAVADNRLRKLTEARADVARLKRLMLKAQGIVGHIADDPGLGREERMRLVAVSLELVAAGKESKKEAAQTLEPK